MTEFGFYFYILSVLVGISGLILAKKGIKRNMLGLNLCLIGMCSYFIGILLIIFSEGWRWR